MFLPFSASLVRSKQVGLLCRISGLILCFSIYYAFYFMNFSEGSVESRCLFLSLGKVLGLGLLVLGFAPYQFRGRLPKPLWAFIALNGLFCANYLVAHQIYGGGNNLFLNQILFVPFCVLMFKTKDEESIGETMDILLPLLLLQILLSAILEIAGKSLWQNFAFAGGVGNPNSFGLCLVILLTYVWTMRPEKYQFLFSSVLIVGAVLTESLMIACLLALVPLVILVCERNFKRFAWREIQSLVLISYCTPFAQHLTWKIFASLDKLGLLNSSMRVSSVDSRLDQIHYVVNAAGPHDWLQTLFLGHGDGAAFTAIDPQYLCFALNFGIISSIAFAAINLFFLIMALRTTPKYRTFLFTALLAFNFSFLTNRLLAYFPMGFLYMLVIASILKKTSEERLESSRA